MASKKLIYPDDKVTLTAERMIFSISIIERSLGIIEGVSAGLEAKYADPLLGAIEMIENAVKEITDGKRKVAD